MPIETPSLQINNVNKQSNSSSVTDTKSILNLLQSRETGTKQKHKAAPKQPRILASSTQLRNECHTAGPLLANTVAKTDMAINTELCVSDISKFELSLASEKSLKSNRKNWLTRKCS